MQNEQVGVAWVILENLVSRRFIYYLQEVSKNKARQQPQALLPHLKDNTTMERAFADGLRRFKVPPKYIRIPNVSVGFADLPNDGDGGLFKRTSSVRI